MVRFYMLVGLPGSGKSKMADRLKGDVFSSDSLRKELWGDENAQGDNDLLFQELHKRIKENLEAGKNTIYDATNISSKRRKSFVESLNKIKCVKICIFMATDYEVCLKRNKNRDRVVPEEVIKKMYMNFDIPQYREGWDEIKIKRTRSSKKDYDIFEYVDHLATINHDNPYHIFTIGAHIQAVTNDIMNKYMLKFAGDIERLERLLRAALYHDIGKEFTRTFINRKGEKTEVAHYYNHENVSAYMYIMYENETELKNNMNKVLYIADLIGLHMRLNHNEIDLDNIKKKLLKMVGKRELEDLCIINESDRLCR